MANVDARRTVSNRSKRAAPTNVPCLNGCLRRPHVPGQSAVNLNQRIVEQGIPTDEASGREQSRVVERLRDVDMMESVAHIDDIEPVISAERNLLGRFRDVSAP